MPKVLTYTQEDILALVTEDVRKRTSTKSMFLRVLRHDSSSGGSSFEIHVELDAPKPT